MATQMATQMATLIVLSACCYLYGHNLIINAHKMKQHLITSIIPLNELPNVTSDEPIIVTTQCANDSTAGVVELSRLKRHVEMVYETKIVHELQYKLIKSSNQPTILMDTCNVYESDGNGMSEVMKDRFNYDITLEKEKMYRYRFYSFKNKKIYFFGSKNGNIFTWEIVSDSIATLKFHKVTLKMIFGYLMKIISFSNLIAVLYLIIKNK